MVPLPLYRLSLVCATIAASACFVENDPVAPATDDGAGSGQTSGTAGVTSTTGADRSSTGGDDEAPGSAGESGTEGGSESGGEAGSCVCGADPQFGADGGAWCVPGGAPLPGPECPVDIADYDGQPCDALDPPLTNAGCCLGTTIAFCDTRGGVAVVGACAELFEDDCQ